MIYCSCFRGPESRTTGSRNALTHSEVICDRFPTLSRCLLRKNTLNFEQITKNPQIRCLTPFGLPRRSKGFDGQPPIFGGFRRFFKPRGRRDAHERDAHTPDAPRSHWRSIPGTFAAFAVKKSRKFRKISKFRSLTSIDQLGHSKGFDE